MKTKSRIIRKVFRVFLIIIIMLAAMIILPFLFKGKIMEAAKIELNKNLEAKVNFRDFGLGLFSSFPNFSFHLDDFSVVGVNEFEGDTLANIASVTAVIDLFSVFNGGVYEIRRVSIVNPDIYLKIAGNGMVNWDILPESDQSLSAQEGNDAEASAFHIALRKFEIVGANIVYEDIAGNAKLIARNLNHTLRGDLAANRSLLQTKTEISELTYEQGGLAYVNKIFMSFDAFIDADLENSFKNFLSLVPAIYMNDFSEIETSGNLSFNGYVKGMYTETALPSFKLDIQVDNGEFKYPGLPSSVKEINMAVNIENPGGDADKTIIDVKKFHFSMIDNPFDAKLFIKNPVSDPYIAASVNGLIDLSAVSKVYPLSDDEMLSGSIDAKVSFKGQLSTIEKQDYSNFDASGSLLLKEIRYSMTGMNQQFEINHAQMNFSPAYIDLVNFDFKYAESNMIIKGVIEDYLAYAMGNKELKGKFVASSEYFSANQFMSDEVEGAESEMPADTLALAAFMVPVNLDLEFDVKFKKILYDNIELENVRGLVIVKDESVRMRNLKGNIFEGSVGINASYDTKNTRKPRVDFALTIEKISFQKAFKTFGILQKFAPIFDHAIGDFSTSVTFNTLLKEDMNPDWMTFIGNGLMNTSNMKIENVNTLNKLSDALKTESFRSLDINPLKMAFDIQEGKLLVKPFDIVMKGMKANLSGWTSINESIGYDLKLTVPRSLFGGEANNVIEGLLSQANAKGANISLGETIDLAVLIGGTLSDPTVKPLLGQFRKNMVDDIKQNALEEINKKKEELEKNAKAEAQKILNDAEQQAQKIIEEARKQSDQIKKTAREAAQKIQKA
jgi:hypothetical protein